VHEPRRRRARVAALTGGLALAGLAASPPIRAAPPESPGQAEPSAATIDLEPEPGRDAAIERRLATIYAEIPALAEVEVEVEAGVVHLSGQVLDLDAGAEAESIARRVEGVATVANEVAQIRSVERRVRPLLDRLRGYARQLTAFAPLLLIGIIIIAGFWLLARLLARVAERRERARGNRFVRELIGQIVRAGIVVLGIVLALELMGATTLLGALLGTAGVVGLALGFAFRDMAENYIASLLLSLRQPFEPNDLVELDGHIGRVVRLTSRATILLTIDGNHVRIPNATVFKGTIINYTRNPERRFAFELGVAVEADLAEVQALAVATMCATPGVLAQPCPSCLVERFGDSAMIISIAGWVDQREADWLKVSSEARRRIKVAFEQAGVDVPEPIFQVRTRRLEGELDGEPSPRKPTVTFDATLDAAADVRPDEHLSRQVAAEREEAGDTDLLRAQAPIE
jgi:small conductance mechanosensitive channel